MTPILPLWVNPTSKQIQILPFENMLIWQEISGGGCYLWICNRSATYETFNLIQSSKSPLLLHP